MPDLMCPVCGQTLVLESKTCHWEDGHCFDCSKSGYVNLLPPAPGGKRHGGDIEFGVFVYQKCGGTQ